MNNAPDSGPDRLLEEEQKHSKWLCLIWIESEASEAGRGCLSAGWHHCPKIRNYHEISMFPIGPEHLPDHDVVGIMCEVAPHFPVALSLAWCWTATVRWSAGFEVCRIKGGRWMGLPSCPVRWHRARRQVSQRGTKQHREEKRFSGQMSKWTENLWGPWWFYGGLYCVSKQGAQLAVEQL